MGEINGSSATQLRVPPTRSLPFREDCWSEEATSTLVDAWGRRYLELNRGNLRQKDWQEVADVVNARHGHNKKTRRTDVQCKNRIDTLKKKYKIEKAKIAESNGTLTSPWPFFARLDALIGSNVKNQPQKLMTLANSPSQTTLSLPPMGIPLYKKPHLLPPPAVPVEPVVLPQKRQFSSVDDSYFRKNYSAVAAAAAAAEKEGDEDEDGEAGSEEEEEEEEEEEVEEREEGTAEEKGMRRLANAIEMFGKNYERVENMKQRQMVELEKQRMQFIKDLEVQRMQLFMDAQVQLEKLKQAKRSGSDGIGIYNEHVTFSFQL